MRTQTPAKPLAHPADEPRARLLRQGEVSVELGIPEKTLEGWRHRGVGPRYIRVGRHVRYRRFDLDEWLETQTCGPRPAA